MDSSEDSFSVDAVVFDNINMANAQSSNGDPKKISRLKLACFSTDLSFERYSVFIHSYMDTMRTVAYTSAE